MYLARWTEGGRRGWFHRHDHIYAIQNNCSVCRVEVGSRL